MFAVIKREKNIAKRTVKVPVLKLNVCLTQHVKDIMHILCSSYL